MAFAPISRRGAVAVVSCLVRTNTRISGNVVVFVAYRKNRRCPYRTFCSSTRFVGMSSGYAAGQRNSSSDVLASGERNVIFRLEDLALNPETQNNPALFEENVISNNFTNVSIIKSHRNKIYIVHEFYEHHFDF